MFRKANNSAGRSSADSGVGKTAPFLRREYKKRIREPQGAPLQFWSEIDGRQQSHTIEKRPTASYANRPEKNTGRKPSSLLKCTATAEAPSLLGLHAVGRRTK